MPKRRIAIAALVVLAFAGLGRALYRPFPSDRTPEGAYVRIARAVAEDRPEDMFPYLEEDARWSAYTIRDARKKAYERARAAYPEPERSQLLGALEPDAHAADGANVFARLARERGWIGRLRKDLSGALSTEISGERATVVTARGTRYSFRVRDNGIWGLTLFTAEMVAESEKASRDLAMIEAAAADYERHR